MTFENHEDLREMQEEIARLRTRLYNAEESNAARAHALRAAWFALGAVLAWTVACFAL